MKYFFLAVVALFGVFACAQNQKASIVQPVYSNNTEDFYVNSPDVNDSLVKTVASSTQKETGAASTTDVAQDLEVTTEIGTTTIEIDTMGSSSDEVKQKRLEEVVESINEQYESDTQNCQIGSWLSRLWCRMTNWF